MIVTTSVTAIRASDFDPPTHPNRSQWTVGKLRHVIEALDGVPVTLITEDRSGFCYVGVRLIGTDREDVRGAVDVLVFELTGPDGDITEKRTAVSSLGTTIVPLVDTASPGAKWRAVKAYQAEVAAAVQQARVGRDDDGRGTWTASCAATGVDVEYTPPTWRGHVGVKVTTEESGRVGADQLRRFNSCGEDVG